MTFAAEVESMMDDLTEMFGGAITLAKITPAAVNTSTGVRSETTDSQSVSALRRAVRQETGQAGPAGTVREVRVYEVQASTVSIGVPAAGWRITDGSASLEVERVDIEAERKSYVLHARRAA